MTKSRRLLATLLTVLGLFSSAPAPARDGLAASTGTDLWGGPGAKGAGSAGARFDTTVYVASTTPASGAVEFLVGGAVVATRSFTLAARSVAILETPAELDGKGAYLYRVRSDTPVNAWSETYNDTSNGRFGVSFAAFGPSEFLNAGDEASGGGIDTSTSTTAGRARTNVGVLCAGGSTQSCRLEVAAYENGALIGTGILETGPGSVAQNAVGALVPDTAGRGGLTVRLRLLQGSGQPYAIRNNNVNSDGVAVPLAVARGAFSTAPTIQSFTATPSSGCAPQLVKLAWTTTNAARVTISNVSGNLPPSGEVSVTLQAATDLILTAYSSTGATADKQIRVDLTRATDPPTPFPATGTTIPAGILDGILPYSSGVTFSFVKQESQGSTMQIVGAQYFYKAGSTPGTDIIQFSTQGTCGAATATFTATVTAPGAPSITSFTSDPVVGCGPSANIVLSWETVNVVGVQITGQDGVFPANGSYGVTIGATATFTLTATGYNNQRVQKSLTVRVDTSLPAPIVTPNNILVAPTSSTQIFVTGVPDYRTVGFYVVQNQSGAFFDYVTAGQYQYRAGPIPGAVDIIRIYYTNGCGSIFTEFRATTQGGQP